VLASEVGLERGDPAVATEPETSHVPLPPVGRGGQEVLAPGFRPLHRPPEPPGRRGDDQILGVGVALDPEAAAGVHHHDAYLLLGEPEGGRDARAEPVRALARRPEGETAVGPRGRDHDPARLDRDTVHPADAEPRFHHHIGRRETGGGIAHAGGREPGHVVRPGVEHARRARLERALHGAGGGQGLVVHLHRRGRVRRRIGIVGDHRGHHLAHVAHERIGEDRLRRRPEARGRRDRRRDGPRALRQVTRGVDSDDPRHGARGGGVDRAHARVGVRAPHEGRVQHAGEAEILDVAAAAGDEALIFLAAQRGAERIVHSRPEYTSGARPDVRHTPD
jgi:hypothetical protein